MFENSHLVWIRIRLTPEPKPFPLPACLGFTHMHGERRTREYIRAHWVSDVPILAPWPLTDSRDSIWILIKRT